MQTQRQVQTEKAPVDRTEKSRELDALLREVGDDARSLSDSYPKQTLVPEGGE